jgi:hypothetical protein
MMSFIHNDRLELLRFESGDVIGVLQGLPGSNNTRGVSIEEPITVKEEKLTCRRRDQRMLSFARYLSDIVSGIVHESRSPSVG